MSRIVTVLVSVLAGAAVAVGLWQVAEDLWRGPGEEPNPFEYDLEELAAVPSELLTWQEGEAIKLELAAPRGLAVNAEDVIYVAGSEALVVFADRRQVNRVDLTEAATAVAVAADGRVYLAIGDHVEVLGPDLAPDKVWPTMGGNSYLTAIAVSETVVSVADAGARVVHRYSLDGQLLGSWDGVDEKENSDGFVVPSPYFDLAVGFEGDLWVVNPGRQSVLGFAPDGRLRSQWGGGAVGPEGFCGCCNPTNLTVLKNGAFVTAEKGLERVKVYHPTGELESVVAAGYQFSPGTVGLDLAIDSHDQILVLDPHRGLVRIFSRKGES